MYWFCTCVYESAYNGQISVCCAPYLGLFFLWWLPDPSKEEECAARGPKTPAWAREGHASRDHRSPSPLVRPLCRRTPPSPRTHRCRLYFHLMCDSVAAKAQRTRSRPLSLRHPTPECVGAVATAPSTLFEIESERSVKHRCASRSSSGMLQFCLPSSARIASTNIICSNANGVNKRRKKAHSASTRSRATGHHLDRLRVRAHSAGTAGTPTRGIQ
jgi:hypothetical protein